MKDRSEDVGMRGVKVLERKNGNVVDEERHDVATVRFVYGSGFFSRLVRAVIRRRWISWMYGCYYDRPAGEQRIRAFAQQLGLDLSVIEKPLHEYRTRNELFSRKLKPGTRPIASEAEVIVSPADSCMLVLPSIDGGNIFVKGGAYSVEELVQDEQVAKRYSQADAAVFRLAPKDYHRFHFPEGGVVGVSRRLPGVLDSVSPYALRRDSRIFCQNQRVFVEVETERFGTILLIAVGAALVGRIVMTYKPGKVQRGQEQGYFEFGASAIVMLVGKGKVLFDEDIVRSSRKGIEVRVQMGERIGRLASLSSSI